MSSAAQMSQRSPFTRTDMDRATAPAPTDVVQVALPPAASVGGLLFGFNILRRVAGDGTALGVARFVNLLLASLLAGNGIGAMLAIHPALRSLSESEFFEAERAITDRYGSIMRVLMPASIASCFNVLRLMRNRRSISFGLTAAGTASMIGMVVTTAIELPLNVRTLRTSPEDVSGWVVSRERWDRFNLLRNALTLAGWIFLCLAALSERGTIRRVDSMEDS